MTVCDNEIIKSEQRNQLIYAYGEYLKATDDNKDIASLKLYDKCLLLINLANTAEELIFVQNCCQNDDLNKIIANKLSEINELCTIDIYSANRATLAHVFKYRPYETSELRENIFDLAKELFMKDFLAAKNGTEAGELLQDFVESFINSVQSIDSEWKKGKGHIIKDAISSFLDATNNSHDVYLFGFYARLQFPYDRKISTKINKRLSDLEKIELNAITEYSINGLYEFIEKHKISGGMGLVAWKRFTKLCIAELTKLEQTDDIYDFIGKYPAIKTGSAIAKAAQKRLKDLGATNFKI